MSDSPLRDPSSESHRSPTTAATDACDRNSRCQNTPLHTAVGAVSWAGDPRADTKTTLCRLVCENPNGVPLVRLAQLISDGDRTDYSARNYTFVSRFAKTSEHFQVIDKRLEITYKGDSYGRFEKSLWVEPQPSAFTCLRRKHQVADPPKPPEGGGSTTSDNVTESTRPAKYAKDRTKAYLNRHLEIGSDALRRSLAAELATELRSIEGRVTVLERTSDREDLPEFLLSPYTTRFNAPKRVRESRTRFDTVWQTAAETYDHAAMATLTTDLSLHDSTLAAADALTESVQHLRRWLARDVSAAWAPRRVGRKLPYLSVLEWTDSGLPHLHVVFFGARSVCSHDALSDYLAEKTGRVVWFDSLTSRGPGARWIWANPRKRPSDAAAAETPRTYLSHALRTQHRLAGMDAGEVTALVENGGAVRSDLWKQALYWASGKQLWTASEDLQTVANDRVGSRSRRRSIDRGLPSIPQYRYVGTAYYADLPGHVKRNGVLLGDLDGFDPPD